MLDISGLYLIVRYIPFWAVPICIISAEYAYVYWLREKKKTYRTLVCLSLCCFAFVVFYYWVGGPERSVRFVIELVKYLSF